MYIIEIIPLTLLPSNVPQLLSYFFNKKLEKGAIVEIPLGTRKVRAVVVASNILEDQKILLKKTGFQLKKISDVVSEAPQVSNVQLKIAAWISRHYYAPLGYCLKTVLPNFFLKKGYEIIPRKEKIPKQEPLARKPLFLLSQAQDTLNNILPFIKKAVETQAQVALIVPDTSTIEHFYQTLAQNHEVVKIFSALSNKELYNAWKKISSGQADIILGTRQALFAPFNNLKLVIVDDVLHEFYKSDMTPKYNTPDLAKTVADLHEAKTIFVSPITGIENYYHLKNKDYELLDKIDTTKPLKVINMVSEIKGGNFSIFSEKLKEQILHLAGSPDQGKKILIFSPRRGYSGVLVCQNCGYAVKCKECETAFRVHKTTNLVLVCHHCSRSIKMPETCPNCSSFKLKPVGPAGTQKIYDETQRILMMNNLKVPVLIMDTDVIKNETEEEEILQEIKGPRTSIIISTQMIFSHRYDISFDLIGVLNADSIINTPDFKIEEGLFCQIEKLSDFRPKNMILQTYNPENQAILATGEGGYKNFYQKELEMRRLFSYPPFSKLIKLTYRHKDKNRASYEARILSEKLKMTLGHLKLNQKIKMIDSHPSFVEKERGLFAYNIILKVLRSEWSPDGAFLGVGSRGGALAHPGNSVARQGTLSELENIKDVLKYIPSNWSIDVDPRSII